MKIDILNIINAYNIYHHFQEFTDQLLVWVASDFWYFLIFKDFPGKSAGFQGQVAAIKTQPVRWGQVQISSPVPHRYQFTVDASGLSVGQHYKASFPKREWVFRWSPGRHVGSAWLACWINWSQRTSTKTEKNAMKMVMSWELTYPPPRHFWRWFSFSPSGIC